MREIPKFIIKFVIKFSICQITAAFLGMSQIINYVYAYKHILFFVFKSILNLQMFVGNKDNWDIQKWA